MSKTNIMYLPTFLTLQTLHSLLQTQVQLGRSNFKPQIQLGWTTFGKLRDVFSSVIQCLSSNSDDLYGSETSAGDGAHSMLGVTSTGTGYCIIPQESKSRGRSRGQYCRYLVFKLNFFFYYYSLVLLNYKVSAYYIITPTYLHEFR